MDITEQGEPPVIGKDVAWEIIVGKACRVKQFTPFAHIVAGELSGNRGSLPYGSLLLESPALVHDTSMPVTHKEDFRNLWEVFRQRGIGPKEEVLVFYEPFFRSRLLRFLSHLMPRLHVHIYPKGRLEKLYDPGLRPDEAGAWLQPIAVWQPKDRRRRLP
jgi:hypothetical protein